MQELNRTIADYGAAWQETDATSGLNLLTQCFAENGRYVDPTADVSRVGSIVRAYWRMSCRTANGRVDITSRALTAHHDVVYILRGTWSPGRGDHGDAGHDFIQTGCARQNRVHLAGFFGDPAPLGLATFKR